MDSIVAYLMWQHVQTKLPSILIPYTFPTTLCFSQAVY